MKTRLDKPMKSTTQSTRWLVLLLSLAGPSMAHADFTDGFVNRNGWYLYAKNADSSLEVTSVASSGRLELKSANTDGGVANNFAAVRPFTAVDMTVVGAKVTLQLDFLTLENHTLNRGIGIGLYDSGGTPITADTSSGTTGDDDSGYFTYIRRNPYMHRLYENNGKGILETATAIADRANDDTDGLRVGGVAGSGAHVAGVNSGIWYTYKLEIEAIEGAGGPTDEVDHLVTVTLFQGVTTLSTMTYTDTGTLVTNIDQVAVLSMAGNDVAIDNVSVNTATKYYHLGLDDVTIGTASRYSTVDGSTTPAASVDPGPATDLIFYNSTVTGPADRKLVMGTAQKEFRSMTFRNNAGASQINRSSVTVADNGNNVVLIIGAGGITLDPGAGHVTFAAVASTQRVTVGAAASLSLRNNSSSDLTFNRGFDGRAPGVTSVITIDGSGSGGTIFNAEGIKDQSSGRVISLVIDTEGFARIAGTANNYSGGTTLKKGSLQINANAGTGNPLGTGGLTINGGALAAYGSTRTVVNNVTVGGNFTLGGAGQTITLTGTMNLGGATREITLGDSATINGLVSNGGLTINGGSSTNTLGWANVFTGETLMNSGSLKLNNVAAVQNSTVTLTGAAAIPLVFDQSVTADAFTLGGLSAASAGAGKDIALQNNENTPKAVALTVGNNNQSTTYAGALSGPGSLIKTGNGTLTISGANTFSGATTINTGTLLVNGTHTGGSGYSVDIGATLGGGGTITANASVSGIVSPGSTGGSIIGQLNVIGNVTWNGASPTPVSARDWQFQLGENNASDVLNITGDFSKGSGDFFRFNFGGTTNQGTFELVDWSGNTGFSATDFSYDPSSLGANQDVFFQFNGTQLEVVLIAGCDNPPTVTLGASPTVCQGTTSTSISYSNPQNAPDQYYIDYSDTANTSGGFIDVGVTTLGASPIPLSVPVAAPVGTYDGTLYVVNSMLSCRSVGIAFTVTVTDTPSTPGSISGSATVCHDTSGVSYSIAAVASATTYTWAVPANATLVSGQNTTSITVDWGAAGSGNITVNAGNACGTSANQSLSVTVLAGVPGAPVANVARVITATSFLASWSPVSGAAGYQLDVATTVNFQAGTFVVNNQSVAGTSTTVGSLTTGVTYYYRVRASNACGAGGNSDVITAVPSPILAAWDVSGLSDYGSSPEAATAVNADVTVGGLTRGSGLSAGTTAVRGWGGTDWADTEASAINGNKVATFTIKGNANRNVSFTSISTFDYRLDAATGPSSGKLQYALDGSTFTDVPGATFTYDVSASGGSVPPIELSGVNDLRNVPDSVTVTFRIVNYGATATDQPWFIYDKDDSTANDFEVRGTICISPTSYALNGGGTFCLPGFENTELILAGSEAGVTYQLKLGGTDVGSPVAGTGSAISFGQHSDPGAYSVLATRDSGGCSKAVGSTTITILTTPGVPSAFSATLNGTDVDLGWTAPAGTVTGYKIYRRTSSGSYGAAVATISDGATTTYKDTPEGDETYFYQITALNGSCEGAASSPETGPVVVPANCPDGIRPVLTTQGLTALAAYVRVNVAPSLDISIIARDSTGCTTPPAFAMSGLPRNTPGSSLGVTITDTLNSPAAGSSTRRIQWTPDNNQVDTYQVTLTATDSEGLPTSITFMIFVGTQSDTVSGGVPSSQTNWNIPITDLRVPSSGNATVVWTSVDGIHYDVYGSANPIGGGASWSKDGDTVEAEGILSTSIVVTSGTRYYNVVPSGQPANERGVWGVVRPSIPSSVSFMSAPLLGNRDFGGAFGAEMAAALTTVDTKIYILVPGSDSPGDPIDWIILDRTQDGWTRFGGGALPELNPGQGFIVNNLGSPASPTFSGPVGNTGAQTITLAGGTPANPAFNIIGISEGKAVAASTAFDGISVVGSFDENQADQVVIMNPFRRLIRRPNGTWYDTGRPNDPGETNLRLMPGQAYYYIRRGGGAELEF